MPAAEPATAAGAATNNHQQGNARHPAQQDEQRIHAAYPGAALHRRTDHHDQERRHADPKTRTVSTNQSAEHRCNDHAANHADSDRGCRMMSVERSDGQVRRPRETELKERSRGRKSRR